MMEILDIISKHDGKLNWYKLDRGLSSRGVIPPRGLMVEIKDLLNKGYLSEIKSSNPAMPFYALTSKGWEFIKKCGSEKLRE